MFASVVQWAVSPLPLAVLGVALFALVVWLGLRVIPEDFSGLVVKRFGARLDAGRVIALDGEAGYQAAMLSPGWHFPIWRWRYKVERVPLIVVPAGEKTSRTPRRSSSAAESAAVSSRS